MDVSYSHQDPVTYNEVFDPELVDVGPMVGGRDRVQFAWVWDYPEYYTGRYSGLAIDNFELHLVDGPEDPAPMTIFFLLFLMFFFAISIFFWLIKIFVWVGL